MPQPSLPRFRLSQRRRPLGPIAQVQGCRTWRSHWPFESLIKMYRRPLAGMNAPTRSHPTEPADCTGHSEWDSGVRITGLSAKKRAYIRRFRSEMSSN